MGTSSRICENILPLVAKFLEEEIEEEEGDMKSEPFEDNPMPVITANIERLNQQAKVLIDSGASINLVTQEIADALIAKGHTLSTAKELQIRTANGERVKINTCIKIALEIENKQTKQISFFIMKKLPFDMIIGNPTLIEWKASLSWESYILTLSLSSKSAPLHIKWKNYRGQHWRRPISLLASKDVTIPPFTQQAIPLQGRTEQECVEKPV